MNGESVEDDAKEDGDGAENHKEDEGDALRAFRDKDENPSESDVAYDVEEGGIFDAVEDVADAVDNTLTMEDLADALDSHAEAQDDTTDAGRDRAKQNPKASNHKWVPFTFTLKHDVGRGVFSWQCSCPFHKLNDNSGCKRTLKLESGHGLSFEAENERDLDLLRHWSNQALKYSRQRGHMGMLISEGRRACRFLICLSSSVCRFV